MSLSAVSRCAVSVVRLCETAFVRLEMSTSTPSELLSWDCAEGSRVISTLKPAPVLRMLSV